MNKDHFAHKRRAIMLRIARTERMLRFDHEHEAQVVALPEQHSHVDVSQEAHTLVDVK